MNVSQLQAEDATVDKLGADAAAHLGGGAAYTATTGAISAPSYSVTNLTTQINSGEVGLVQQSAAGAYFTSPMRSALSMLSLPMTIGVSRTSFSLGSVLSLA